MKIRVIQKYTIHMTEVHEIEFGPDEQEAIDILHEEGADEFTTEETLVEKTEGDCVSGSWEVSWVEISPLDQIVDAMVKSDAVPVPQFIKDIDASPYLDLG